MTATDRRVRETFIELTDTLVTDFDIIEFLGRLSVRCTDLLGVAACGVLLADHHGVLNAVAASTEETRLLELSQLQDSEGPCLDAYRTGEAVQCVDLADAGMRWPAFSAAARDAGFAAVQALPMRLREQILGALSLFSIKTGPLDDDTIALGQALADAATIGIVHQRALARSEIVAGQLQNALNSRIAIEQAKGFVAERLGLTIDEAFAVLRRYARDHNRKLTAVAYDAVHGRLNLTATPLAAPNRPGSRAASGELPRFPARTAGPELGTKVRTHGGLHRKMLDTRNVATGAPREGRRLPHCPGPWWCPRTVPRRGGPCVRRLPRCREARSSWPCPASSTLPARPRHGQRWPRPPATLSPG